MQQKDLWNKQANSYLNKKIANNTSVFKYEVEINTPSILSLCPRNKDKVLDLGCGEGSFTKLLSKRYQDVTGADYSADLLDIARKRFPEILFIEVDLEKPSYSFIEKYSLIVSKLTLMYISDLFSFADNCYYHLLDGGTLVISVTHPVRWYSCFLENKFGVKKRAGFDAMGGYFSEVWVNKNIGSEKSLSFEFFHRTLSSYIRPFLRAGFVLTGIDEPQMTSAFLKKFPKSSHQTSTPLRLNLQFTK